MEVCEIKGYKYKYYATSDGRILKEDKELSSSDNGIGYLFVQLKNIDGKRVNRYIHRLVFEAFNGEITGEINHIDHNKKNNSINNLENVTHSENVHKAFLKYGYFGSLNKPKPFEPCPICGGKKARKSMWCDECRRKYKSKIIPQELIEQEYKNFTSFLAIGRKYGVTDNTVRKWFRKCGFPTSSREILKQKIDN